MTVCLLLFVAVVVAIGGNEEVVSMTGITEFIAFTPLTTVEILDVIVVFEFLVVLDTITAVVFEVIVLLELVVTLGPVAIVTFIVAFVVVFIGIHVCLIISAPFSAIMVVGAFVLALTI